jgi:hypothetical protein
MSQRIVEIEYELFLAIRNGHRPSYDDCYRNKRTELDFLRCLHFGIESKFCKIKKGT